STTIGMVVVPNVVGKDLATARAIFAAAGFNRLTANDGTQRKRVPTDDWIVYRQSPRAGEPVLTSVYMYLELLQKGERYTNPGTSPCPRFTQC
ncbi:MAG: PASTA domain-containing protein, partial [Actinobacteria bacterium]|nr:PASTA domain-containing protein [Actinomycetota bacterium]